MGGTGKDPKLFKSSGGAWTDRVGDRRFENNRKLRCGESHLNQSYADDADFALSPISTAMQCMHFGEYNSSPEDDPLNLYPHSKGHINTPISDDEYYPRKSQESRQKRYTRRRSALKKPTPTDPGWTAKHYKRHFVDHNYHDHSHDKEDSSTSATDSVGTTPTKTGVVAAFPIALYNMLDTVDKLGLSHIVSWQPHGRAFSVHAPKAFVEQVMPLFFRQSKISSFQRQLNLYGFRRLTGKTCDQGAYYNEFFLRGRSDLTTNLQRIRVKGTGVRTSNNPWDEPNFYEMERVGSSDHLEPTPTSMSMSILLPRLQGSEMKRPKEIDMPPSSMSVPYYHGEYEPPETLFDSPRYEQAATAMDLGDVDIATTELALFLNDVDLASEDPFKGEPRLLIGAHVDQDDATSV